MAAATSDLGGSSRLRWMTILTAVAIGILALTPRWDDVPWRARPAARHVPAALAWSPRTLGAIGSIRLGDQLSTVLAGLGPATSESGLAIGTRLRWEFEGDVVVLVETSGGLAPTVLLIEASVDDGVVGPSLAFGLTLGRSSIADVVARWGPPATTGIPVASAIAYDTCAGLAAARVVLDAGDTDPHLDPIVRHVEVSVRGPFCAPSSTLAITGSA